MYKVQEAAKETVIKIPGGNHMDMFKDKLVRKMTAQEILEKYDTLAKSAGDGEAEHFLAEQCTGYDEAAPEDLTGRAALYNELGGFYCAAGSYEKSETSFN